MKVEVIDGNVQKALSIWKNRLKSEHFYEEIERSRHYVKPNKVRRLKLNKQKLRMKHKGDM